MPVNTVIEKWFMDGKYTPYDSIILEEVIRYALPIVLDLSEFHAFLEIFP